MSIESVDCFGNALENLIKKNPINLRVIPIVELFADLRRVSTGERPLLEGLQNKLSRLSALG